MDAGRNYSIFTIDLSNAASLTLDEEGGFLQFVTAENAAGVQQLDAKVTVEIGPTNADRIPFQINSSLRGYFKRLTIRWAAQPGWTATFFRSRGNKPDWDLEPIQVSTPPTKQLITSAFGSNIATAQVASSTTRFLIAAARSTRQSISVKNVFNASELYIGDNTVTAGTGWNVPAGSVWWSDKFSGALYGILGGGTGTVYVEEIY